MSHETLDTNILLRLVVADVPSQFKTAQQLLTQAGTQFSVPDQAIVELVYALTHHYGLTRDQVFHVVTEITDWENINCHAELLSETITFWRDHPKLSFEDCLLAEIAKAEHAIPLWTFDKKLTTQHPAAQELTNLHTN